MAEKKFNIEEKRKIGEEYYSRLSDSRIDEFLEGVWYALFHSSSQRKYPDDPKRALNAIDMLIDVAKKRFGDVESAPISTFLYNRDMTNADHEIKVSFQRKGLDGSPDNHPEFAAREAKIFAFINSRHYYRAKELDCYRQGKGFYNSYLYLGYEGHEFMHNYTIKDIEEELGDDLYNLNRITADAIIAFRCSGEYRKDVYNLLEKMIIAEKNAIVANVINEVKEKGLGILPRKMQATIINKIKKDKNNTEFVEKHINELTDPKNRKAVENLYRILDNRKNYGEDKIIADLHKALHDKLNTR